MSWYYVTVMNDDLQPDPFDVGPFRDEGSAGQFIYEIKKAHGDAFSLEMIPLIKPRDFILEHVEKRTKEKS